MHPICQESLFADSAETRWSRASWVLLAALVCLQGCSNEDTHLQTLRQQYVLATEPPGPTTIAEAKTQLADKALVKIVGRIPIDEDEAFTRGEATFFVSEMLPDDHGHADKDHIENCPFCKLKAASAPQAAIQFVDKEGVPLAVDARELFGIGPGDTVVIQGTAELISKLDVFVVTADGIYLRRSGA